MPATTDIQYSIRQFIAADVAAYKAMRLEALQSDPSVFGTSYATEAAFGEEQWLQRVTNPNNACFGLYANDELIGITGIVTEGRESGDAYLTQSYIRKAYRGKKLSRMLYEARLAWAKAHNIRRLIISHKRTNLASKGANQHFGFRYTHSQGRQWPDGSIEDMLFYELVLT